ncbi:MAG: hypothetical protein BGO94_10300 [Micrococcales bacterium 72-143]|nr:MAG: hypothetical protein BGO94_10300 [Micrococcales bacterium 72-143]
MTGAPGGPGGEDQTEGHPRDGRVHTGLQHERPDGDPEDDEQDGTGAGSGTSSRAQPAERRDERHGEKQRDGFQLAREEHGDDADRDEVVEHREGEEEGPHAPREAPPEQREHAERERDVGRRGDRPSDVLRRVAHEREVEQCGDDDAARRGDRGRERLARGVELATGELVPQLDRRDEEEYGEQSVRDPVPGGEVEHAQSGVRMRVAEREHRGPPRRVGCDEPERRGGRQHHRCRAFGAEKLHGTHSSMRARW